MDEMAPDAPIAPSELLAELDGSVRELTYIPLRAPQIAVAHNRVLRKPQLDALDDAARGTALSLCHTLFAEHWREIAFGPCIQGAVFELQLEREPERISYLDGYLTVFLGEGPAHLHLCVGPHRGLKEETPRALAQKRACGRAAFVRTFDAEGAPRSWSVELWNGAGEPMVTFFLPSPYLDLTKEKRLREPNWAQLTLWNTLRARFLGERAPQPLPCARGAGPCG